MKYVKTFENFSVKENIKYSESNRIIDDVIVVDSDKDFKDNPLFYVWSEYPKYKKMKNGILLYQYEFYKDKNNNKYFIADGTNKISDDEIKELISKHDWLYARNVDSFVEGADADDYKRWLELIS